jgi:5'-3' exonuclease
MMHKEMREMGIPAFFTAYSLKHAAIEKLVRLGMELPKINKSTRLDMNSTVALSHYSPLAPSNNTVCALITKDQSDQKE